jgi:FAD/FMN-containing dehydrogenase/Fe-S oxidoreductase
MDQSSPVLLRIEPKRLERQRAEDAPRGIDSQDVRDLEHELRQAIRGEVRFDRGSRALYATDGSNYRQVPIGVVVPRDTDDVVDAVRVVRTFGAPILSRGGGTSLAGQCCNVAVVLDHSKYLRKVIDIDPSRKLAIVEPGCVLDDLRKAAQVYGLTFGPDPATHTHCTLGGMLGNNSCGVHSLICRNAGLGLRTSDNTHELEVLTYEGLRLRVGPTPAEAMQQIIAGADVRAELYKKLQAFRDRYGDAIRQRFPKLPRRVSGFNLDELLPENGFHLARGLVGSEATLVTILQATLHLVPQPAARSLVVFGYPDIYSACDHLMEILEFNPTGLEGMDHLLYQWVQERGDREAGIHLLPPGHGFLLVEFGGDSKAEADANAKRCIAAVSKSKQPPSHKLYDDPHEESLVWAIREGGLGSTAWVQGHPDGWPGWEDSAVPPEQVGGYMREFRQLLDRYGYEASLYGHFGQGCVHCRISFDLYTAEGIAKFRSFLNDAADLVLRHGGSLSGEHGDGQARGELLPKMYGDELVQAFREFKRIWDPQWKMNPGKVVDPAGITEHLRLGTDYHPPRPQTHFRFSKDQGSFARAALRCVGVGECRKESGGVMCPSYMVTHEEKHSTRGRARLLWEMMNGEVITDGWRSEEVKSALDLCLACKGCRHDCPVSVDMATYKAEFLSHYYAGRLRPRHAYAMGWIHHWARLASLAPSVANWFGQSPIFAPILKWLAGVAPQRQLPPFAKESFVAWFHRRQRRNQGMAPVLLWADTFNNYFHPGIARAAVEVLELAGYCVHVPRADYCCGRPLYDFGMLTEAKRRLREILIGLQPAIEAGVPIVVLEPSCLAVFRDELLGLFPNDEDAKRLSRQAVLLSELLLRKTKGYEPPRLNAKATVHAHCHHRSVMGFDDEQKLMQAMGLEVQTPEPGCCGMAGSFGFERGEHYKVAMACGERALLPAIRNANDGELLIADGFSCREQIRQSTGRQAVHLAQVLAMAGQTAATGQQEVRLKKQPLRASDFAVPLGLAAGTAVALGLFIWRLHERNYR